MDDQDNHLVSPPPGDSLMHKRMAVKALLRKNRRSAKLASRRAWYWHGLELFQNAYFFGKSNAPSLSDLEQNELAKICFRRSIWGLAKNFVPALAGLWYFSNVPALFGLTLLISAIILVVVGCVLETKNRPTFIDQAKFILAYIFVRKGFQE